MQKNFLSQRILMTLKFIKSSIKHLDLSWYQAKLFICDIWSLLTTRDVHMLFRLLSWSAFEHCVSTKCVWMNGADDWDFTQFILVYWTKSLITFNCNTRISIVYKFFEAYCFKGQTDGRTCGQIDKRTDSDICRGRFAPQKYLT